MDEWMERWMNVTINRCIEGWLDGGMDRRMDGQINRWMVLKDLSTSWAKDQNYLVTEKGSNCYREGTPCT